MNQPAPINPRIRLCYPSFLFASAENFVHPFDDQRWMRLLGRAKILLDAEVYLCGSGENQQPPRPARTSGLEISPTPSAVAIETACGPRFLLARQAAGGQRIELCLERS